MSIFQTALIAVISTALIVLIKKTNPEFAICISIITGIIILSYVTGYICEIKDVVFQLVDKFNLDFEMFSVVVKILAISYLCEFASGICKDAGESSNAMKIEFAGKIVIVFLTVPIILSLVDLLFSLI